MNHSLNSSYNLFFYLILIQAIKNIMIPAVVYGWQDETLDETTKFLNSWFETGQRLQGTKSGQYELSKLEAFFITGRDHNFKENILLWLLENVSQK